MYKTEPLLIPDFRPKLRLFRFFILQGIYKCFSKLILHVFLVLNGQIFTQRSLVEYRKIEPEHHVCV